MRLYQVVGGVAGFGPGQVLQLNADQIAGRLHNLEIVEGDVRSGEAIVRTLAPIEFKIGERVGLAELPKSYAGLMVPVGAPQTEVEENAVVKAEAAAKAEAEARQVAADRQAGKRAGKRQR